jgi:hypothetical protein
MFLISGLAFLPASYGLAFEEVPEAVWSPGATASTVSFTPTVVHSISATASTLSETAAIELAPVTVVGRAENLLGSADSGSSGTVGQDDLSHRALLRPAEVLEAVPGLLITQHSGDGKANQYFTRGFNLDHGTDFAFSMEGVPVNEVSNAHGQGYSDLNFLIPELVDRVTYAKGPVNVEAGDFNTAGSADFRYVTDLKQTILSDTLGDFGYHRALFASQLNLGGQHLLYALEMSNYDGPWTVPENNKKYNVFLRYSTGPSSNRFSLSASFYGDSYAATNQIPESLEGMIGEFGSLDPTDKGERTRNFVWADWSGRTGDTQEEILAYVGVSRMDLFNDFTYNLYHPYAGEGDQFEQLDERTREGATVRLKFDLPLGGLVSKNEIGADFRNDNITALKLYDTCADVPWAEESANHVVETSGAPYVKNETQWTPWLRSEVGFRQDFYHFQVGALDADQITEWQDDPNTNGAEEAVQGALPSQSADAYATIPEPKANLIFRPAEGPLEIYLNYDWGYHSNDARSITPYSISQNGVNPPPLAQAKSEELGFRYANKDRYEGTLAFWYLDMDSELTFDGDVAQSDINNASYRKGIEWSNTWRWKPFFADLDYAFSSSRFRSLDSEDDPSHPGMWVPEAIKQVGTATLGLDKIRGCSTDLRIRYFGPRDLTADGDEEAPAFVLFSLHLSREINPWQTLNLDVFNLFNVQAADVSYYYSYRTEADPNAANTEDYMVHTTEPRSLRLSWVGRF